MLQVQLPAGIIIITTLSPYEVDDALSCHGSKMVIWKPVDVVYSLIFLREVITFHASRSDVFECLSVRLKRIGYYALRFIFDGVFNMNLLVLDFSLGF